MILSNKQSMYLLDWLNMHGFTLKQACDVLIEIELGNTFGFALLNALNNKEDHDNKIRNPDWGNPLTP